MRNIIIVIAGALALSGCMLEKTRSLEANGMWIDATNGRTAIGNVEIESLEIGSESASIKYSEDTAWLSPSTKTHNIKILLAGTNACLQASSMIKDICTTFALINSPTNTPSAD